MSLRPPTRGGSPPGRPSCGPCSTGSTPRSGTVRATLRRRTATSPGAARPWRGAWSCSGRGGPSPSAGGPRGAPPLAALRRCIPARRSWCPASPGTTRGRPSPACPEVFERSAFAGQGGAAIDGAPALEARIAALASSGEEDVSYSQVERRLRDWLNRRKHNKTGLIPAGGGAGRRGGDPGPPVQGLPSGPGGQAGAGAAPGRAQTSGVRAGRPPQPGHGPAQGPVGGGPGRPCRGPGPGGRPGGRAYPPRSASRPGYPEKGPGGAQRLNTLHANRKLAESQLEEARAAEAEAGPPQRIPCSPA